MNTWGQSATKCGEDRGNFKKEVETLIPFNCKEGKLRKKEMGGKATCRLLRDSYDFA